MLILIWCKSTSHNEPYLQFCWNRSTKFPLLSHGCWQHDNARLNRFNASCHGSYYPKLFHMVYNQQVFKIMLQTKMLSKSGCSSLRQNRYEQSSDGSDRRRICRLNSSCLYKHICYGFQNMVKSKELRIELWKLRWFDRNLVFYTRHDYLFLFDFLFGSIVVFFIPIYILVILHLNKDNLENMEIQEKYGQFFNDFRVDHDEIIFLCSSLLLDLLFHESILTVVWTKIVYLFRVPTILWRYCCQFWRSSLSSKWLW